MMSSSVDELLTSTDAVSITGLRVVRGGSTVLHDLDLTIGRGSITGLLGPSGCGKTTLMRCIVGTQVIAGGRVEVLGRPAGSPALRHRVGYVTQNPTVYGDLKVIDNVRYFAALHGATPSAAAETVSAVGLDEHRNSYAPTCPAGSAAGCPWRARWSARRISWYSTSRRWVWTRFCEWSSGTGSATWPAAAPPCWSPAM